MIYLKTFEAFNDKHRVMSFPYPRKTTELEEMVYDEKAAEESKEKDEKKDKIDE